jgi:hypothetical protein
VDKPEWEQARVLSREFDRDGDMIMSVGVM